MSDQLKQVVITLQDIKDNLYVFGPDVVTEHKTGVSKTGSTEAQSSTPESTFIVRYGYKGATLADLQPLTDYKLGVNFRASCRGTGRKPAWIPEAGSKVDVLVTNKGNVDVKTLPAEIQAQMLFGGIDDLVIRRKAIKAFLAAL